ncbi:hypothetical protein NIES2135_67310 (plasmid) [Leptolyngbya boryana NIES-2135]|jgi:hypothetical protein|uniref:Uncharacterized protein n=1 Tax=Leptolyngbya boryana NIES-2135 TaxID=1973484 RepID=A0A1Z4JSZ3_LEPBY|nr:hypothetical protein NIES2135_67310 [Leptolyngbya boryana NIES-2135]
MDFMEVQVKAFTALNKLHFHPWSATFWATLIAWSILVTPVFAQTQSTIASPVVQAVQQALQKNMDYPSKARSQFGVGQVTKVAVLPPYAMATWTWGPTGGWAILIERNRKWQVVTRRDDWIGLRGVIKFGVPESVAIQLLDQIIPDWKTLPSE